MASGSPHDQRISTFLNFLGIGLSKFVGRVRLSAILTFGSEQRVFDSYALLEQNKHVVSRRLGERKDIITVEVEAGVEPQKVELFLATSINIDNTELLEHWLRLAGNLLVSTYQKSMIAAPATMLAWELMSYWSQAVVANFIETRYGFKNLEPLIGAIQSLSRSVEEQAQVSGSLVWPVQAYPNLLIEFSEKVALSNTKHCGKLLAVTKGSGYLVVQDGSILGVIDEPNIDDLQIKLREGFTTIQVGGRSICQIVNGEFRGCQKPFGIFLKEVVGKEVVKDAVADTIGTLVNKALDDGFGCSILIETTSACKNLVGHKLKNPLSLEGQIETVVGMAKVDGGIQMNSNGEVMAFGCLLDGRSQSSKEILARGSRFNSAVRFCARLENNDVCVIVVSSDGPISIFYKGEVLYSDPWLLVDSDYDRLRHITTSKSLEEFLC